MIYAPENFSNLTNIITRYRHKLQVRDIDICLGCFTNVMDFSYGSLFDVIVSFSPRNLFRSRTILPSNGILNTISKKLPRFSTIIWDRVKFYGNSSVAFDYDEYIHFLIKLQQKNLAESLELKTSVTLGWNNTPRYRDNFTSLLHPNNDQFQKSAKQQQMDSSYERLMAERQLIK